MLPKPSWLPWVALLVCSADVVALDFRSVAEPAAVLYDAPALNAQKLFILSPGYPVEVVVKLGVWSKVRDDAGQFAWVENANLSDHPTVMVQVKTAEARQAATDASPVVFVVQQNVILDLLEATAGWVKVRHKQGATGFIKASQLWGL